MTSGFLLAYAFITLAAGIGFLVGRWWERRKMKRRFARGFSKGYTAGLQLAEQVLGARLRQRQASAGKGERSWVN